MNIFKPEVDQENYIVATYDITCRGTLAEGAWALAVGQSIGNPSIRNKWETQELIDNHACMILHEKRELESIGMTVSAATGRVQIGFPLENINLEEDGISQLLCQLMGGQMDIDSILACRLVDIKFPSGVEFRKPKYGITGIREYTGVYDKPLLGGIIKPKIGLRPNQLLDMVKEMVDGGVNFIKEDEIMSDPRICHLRVRAPLINEWLYINAPHVIYALSITSDYPYILNRVRKAVMEWRSNAVHVNIWNGMGVYKAIRELNLPMFLFFQKSGDKVITDPSHRFGIDWNVICKLAAWSGVDFIHAGMWGGYMNNDEKELSTTLNILRSKNVMPSLSCGMKPDLIAPITEKFGVDYMATVGGYIHGHPEGTLAGVKEMYRAIQNI